MGHLDQYNLLSDKQHTFRKWNSCETQLNKVISDWAKILEKRVRLTLSFGILKKAFDTLPHELLKSKLLSYGIGGNTLEWVNAFLCFRQQKVVVNCVKSDWAPVDSQIRLFAGDCVCYCEI